VTDGDPERVQRVIDLIRQRGNIAGLTVLDLACRTGAFATALAAAGATVLGVDGRQENLDHAPASTAQYMHGDVRDLSTGSHGTHDVTLCLGILYHLDPADAFGLLTAMRAVTSRFAIVDTHTGADTDTVHVAGVEYRGSWYTEPDGPWSAIGNPRSWWFTEQALHDAARNAGWKTVEPIAGPVWPGEAGDRRWLVLS
jgi:SAM-dependent methyltransferase